MNVAGTLPEVAVGRACQTFHVPYDHHVSFIAPVAGRAHDVVRNLWREAAKFGVVGAIAFVLDNGGYTVLVFGLPEAHGHHGGPMASWPVTASVLATAAATLFSWAGNRYWTYRHQRRSNVAHELVLFLLVNAVGMAVTAAAVWVSRDLFGLHTVASDNAARVTGWALATGLRFLAYRRYVFVAVSS